MPLKSVRALPGFCAVWWAFLPGSRLRRPWGSPLFFDSGQVGECAALPSGAYFHERPEMPGELGGFPRGPVLCGFSR
jgi:hypothetical protein